MAEDDTNDLNAYVAKHHASASASGSDPLPAAAWVIRGLTGAVNLLDGMTAGGYALPQHWHDVLETEIERLMAIAARSE